MTRPSTVRVRRLTLLAHARLATLLAAGLLAVAGPVVAQSPDTTGARAHADSLVRRDSAAHADSLARRDCAVTLTLGGFLDAYYAWDSNRPAHFDRAYTTQAARHAEFNVNLAFIEARVSGDRIRGRLALQYGTAVQANYAGEPRIGTVSGPSVSQFLQEAWAGYQLGPTLWLDGGIFFAHTGYEGFISRDNLTYTRSLIADFSPYYEAGVRLTWTPNARTTAQVDVVNGWQDISNYNTPPAVGIRVDYQLTPRTTLSYDNFVGNASADSVPVHLRVFHDLIVQQTLGAWSLAGAFDVGTQSRSARTGGTALWYGAAVFAKYHLSPTLAVVGRVERYADPEQVIITTGLPQAFAATGGSLGGDVQPRAHLLWRTELRALAGGSRLFPTHTPGGVARDDLLGVSSFSLTF